MPEVAMHRSFLCVLALFGLEIDSIDSDKQIIASTACEASAGTDAGNR